MVSCALTIHLIHFTEFITIKAIDIGKLFEKSTD